MQKKMSKKAIEHFSIMNMQISNFIDGIRIGMEVPADWRFDQSQMAFVAPETEGRANLSAAAPTKPKK